MGKKNTPKKSGFNTQKIFKIVRLVALGLPAAQTLMSGQQPATMINQLKKDYFGVDATGRFDWRYLGKGWLPFLASIGITYGIPKIAGMIRRA